MFISSRKLSGGSLHGRFVQHRLPSEHLGGERTVTVRYPENYQPDKQYPVLYLQDGQNMFDRRTAAFGQEWRADETFSQLVAQGKAPDAFLVAVDNGLGDRTKEYTHVPDPEYRGGEGAKYEDFLLEEVIPAVEAAYPIDAQKRVMMGSSLGGLVSLAVGLNHPTSFAAVGALSASVWWADGQMPTQILSSESFPERPRVWLDMGDQEGGTDEYGRRQVFEGEFEKRPQGSNGIQDVRDRTRETAIAMLQKGWKLDGDLRYHEPPGARHNEASWAARFGNVTEWLMRGL